MDPVDVITILAEHTQVDRSRLADWMLSPGRIMVSIAEGTRVEEDYVRQVAKDRLPIWLDVGVTSHGPA